MCARTKALDFQHQPTPAIQNSFNFMITFQKKKTNKNRFAGEKKKRTYNCEILILIKMENNQTAESPIICTEHTKHRE
jgi:hypothetical protein